MLVKDYCGCNGKGCQSDYIYFNDNNCDDAEGDYDYWRGDNTYVAICLEGDGCCDMPEDQGEESRVGQCLLVDFTKFNGHPIMIQSLLFRVDADSHKHCNNDLYVYGKFEGDNDWRVIAEKLDGSGESGLNGIFLDESYFPKKVSMVAICPNPDEQGSSILGIIGDEYDCDHKIDWVKFQTNEEPDVSACPSGEWSEEFLFREWNGNAGIKTTNYTIKTENFRCEVPGAGSSDTGGCMVTRVYREQVVKDWGACLRKDCGWDLTVGLTPDDGKANEGVFIYSFDKGNKNFEADACVIGSKISALRKYTNEVDRLSLIYKNGESININSTYWELTGSKASVYGKDSYCVKESDCSGKPMKRKCCNSGFGQDHMCASRSYDFDHYSLKVYGRYCCPKGMYWDNVKKECVSQ